MQLLRNGLATIAIAGCSATAGQVGGPATVDPDTTPPFVSDGVPKGTLAAGTPSTMMSVTTDEPATCKWDPSNKAFIDMANTFTTTGDTEHTTTLPGLSDGTSYVRHIRCSDEAGNANGMSYLITFRVATFGGIAPSPEPQCPGGSAPEADVIFCDDFEGADQSWLTDDITVSADRPFLGSYSNKFAFGELGGPGYTAVNLAGEEELWIRFYWYFDRTFHWGAGYSDHVLTPIETAGGVTCIGNAGGVDFGPWGPLIYRTGQCDGVRFDDLGTNMGDASDGVIHNGRWYRLDYHVKLNSTGGCQDMNGNLRFDSIGECDGVIELWLDGVQLIGYYDVNFRGNDNPDYRMIDFFWNHYFRTGGQTYNGLPFAEYRDNLVVARGAHGGVPIGAAVGEPADRGTPDLTSPYYTPIYKEWFAFDAGGTGIRPGADCAFRMTNDPYGDGVFAYVASPAHNGTVTYCADQAAGGDKALQVSTSAQSEWRFLSVDGWYNLGGTHVVNGWMNLDASTFPAANGAALSGFSWWASDGRNYVALGVDSANHPLLLFQENQGAASPDVLASNASITLTPGTWIRFEVRGNDSGDWSVLVDGVEALSATGVDASTMFDFKDSNGNALWSLHVGISDHLQNSSPLTVVYDDISFGSTSFEDCFGWDPSSCPF